MHAHANANTLPHLLSFMLYAQTHARTHTHTRTQTHFLTCSASCCMPGRVPLAASSPFHTGTHTHTQHKHTHTHNTHTHTHSHTQHKHTHTHTNTFSPARLHVVCLDAPPSRRPLPLILGRQMKRTPPQRRTPDMTLAGGTRRSRHLELLIHLM